MRGAAYVTVKRSKGWWAKVKSFDLRRADSAKGINAKTRVGCRCERTSQDMDRGHIAVNSSWHHTSTSTVANALLSPAIGMIIL